MSFPPIYISLKLLVKVYVKFNTMATASISGSFSTCPKLKIPVLKIYQLLNEIEQKRKYFFNILMALDSEYTPK